MNANGERFTDEVSTRDKSLMEKVPVENAEQYVKDLVEKMKKECNLVK